MKNKIIFSGVVGFVSEIENGTDKKGQPYSKGFILVGEADEKYPNAFKVDWYNHGKSQIENLKVGHEIEIEVDPKVKEYQGKYYQEIRLVNINNLTAPLNVSDEISNDATVNPFSVAKQTGKAINEQSSDLPF